MTTLSNELKEPPPWRMNCSPPDSCALALIDHQPQMFFGTHSHERTGVMHNVQILAKTAKLFKRKTKESCHCTVLAGATV